MAYLSNYSANSQYVVKAFSALFGSGVTGDLIASGDTILTAGTSTTLVNVLLNNSVVLNSFPLYGANITDTAFAGALIDNMTKGSGVDATTIAGWKTAVAAALPSYPSRAAAVATLIDAVTNYSGTDTSLIALKTVIDNRAEVGAYNAQHGAATFSTLSALQAQTASVDTTAASVTAAQTGATTGSTFTLTKSVQALTGTTGNDTFIAGDEGGAATLNAGDAITGNGGTDTLKIFDATGAANGANFGNAVIKGVANVEFTSVSKNTLNVSANADVKTVTLVNGEDGVVSLKLAQTAGLSGGINTKAAATFTFVDATGPADTGSLTLNAADLVTNGNNGLKIAGVETLNVAATGTNLLGTTAIDATKLVITGAGSVNATLKTSAGTASVTKTIDGSAATGNLVIDNSGAAAAVQSIKTGSGNADIYTTKYADLTADDLIDLGAGTADSLRFADAATFNSTATKALLTKVTGVEQLGTVAATLTVDGDFVSQTSFYTEGAAGAIKVTNVANSDLTFGAGVAGASTAALKLGANTLTVNLEGSKTDAADVTTGLTVTGSSTINVKSSGTAGVADNVLKLTAPDNQNVVVTGSQNLTLTSVNNPSSTGFSIDASAFTGKLNVTGTNDSDVIKGGSGADTIDAGPVTHGSVAVAAANEVQTLTIGQFSGVADPTKDTISVTITDKTGGTATEVVTAAVDLADKAAVTKAIADAVNANATTKLYVTAAQNATQDAVTFTYSGTSGNLDVPVITFNGDKDATAGSGKLAVTIVETTKGAAASAGTTGTLDTLTGNAGADTFAFSTADVDTTAGAVTAIITDFKTGVDKIKVTNGADAGAGSATNYVEATSAASTLTALLSAADTALNGTVDYYVGQVGSDSYLVTDADGTGYTNVIKLTGVALDGIAMADIIAA